MASMPFRILHTIIEYFFNTEVYLYDLKIYDTDYWYVTDLIFWHSRLSTTKTLSGDKPYQINRYWQYIYIYIYIYSIVSFLKIAFKLASDLNTSGKWPLCLALSLVKLNDRSVARWMKINMYIGS